MGIKIVREKKAKDYTFIDDGLSLDHSAEKTKSGTKANKVEPDFRLRDGNQVSKLRKSKITGGHSKQGHSPVYE